MGILSLMEILALVMGRFLTDLDEPYTPIAVDAVINSFDGQSIAILP